MVCKSILFSNTGTKEGGIMKYLPFVFSFCFTLSSYAQVPAKSAAQDSLKEQQNVTQQNVAIPSAPATVKLNTPTLNMDVLLDLYNRDIDFSIDYSGTAFKPPANTSQGSAPSQQGQSGNPAQQERRQQQAQQVTDQLLKPREEDITSDIQDIVDTSKTRRQQRTGTYTKEDADYNRALFSLQESQRLFSLKRYTEALVQINKSIDAAPNLALAHAIKGSIYYMLQNMNQAKISWEKALELDPSMDNVRAILYRLY
jgi:tetratricopeptide (TPR) repeat protein